MTKEICGIKELATYLDMSESGIRKLVREKRIPYFKILSSIKFDLKEINLWIENKQNEESKFSVLLGI
jgi:excisionase family DNA binding protein